MKSRFYIGIFGLLFLAMVSCQEADKTMFSIETPGVYFKTDSVVYQDTALIVREDTLVYSFAYDDEEEVHEREIKVPVQLVGIAGSQDRMYKLEIVAGPNTREGVDYKVVDADQIFHANMSVDTVRVVWKRNLSMRQEVKRLDLRIVAGGDFSVGVDEKLYVCLQASDMLEKPSWWDDWEAGFGSWHQTKLREWIKIWGPAPLEEDLWMGVYFDAYPQECTAILKLREVFEKEVFYDEETGVRLVIPANF